MLFRASLVLYYIAQDIYIRDMIFSFCSTILQEPKYDPSSIVPRDHVEFGIFDNGTNLIEATVQVVLSGVSQITTRLKTSAG